MALTLCACQWLMAETVDEFLDTMKYAPDVEYVELTPDMLLTMLNQKGVNANVKERALKVQDKVSCVQILNGTLPNDSAPLKARLAALTVDNLEEMVNSSEAGELTRVWLQTDGQRCSMIVVVGADEANHDWQVVKLNCDIAVDDVGNLIHYN